MTRATLNQMWDRFQSGYRFVPPVMSLLALMLARVLLWVDLQVPDSSLYSSTLIRTGSAIKARNALSGARRNF